MINVFGEYMNIGTFIICILGFFLIGFFVIFGHKQRDSCICDTTKIIIKMTNELGEK